MTFKEGFVLLGSGLTGIWLVLHMAAFAVCTWAGNGVCVVPS
jgi:hypothetical protein